MKSHYLLFLLFSPLGILAQNLDSLAAVRQVDSLNQVCRNLIGQQQFDQAFEVVTAAEKIALEKLGQESAAYGNCCASWGKLMYSKRDYLGAENWHLKAVAIRGKALGKMHPDYASSLHSLALVYQETSNYDKAEQYYLEAKAIREKVLGNENLDYAWTVNNLANLYGGKGDYEKAILLHLECQAIREKLLGKEHPDYALTLNNLANIYGQKGEYDKIEPLLLESKHIMEKTIGKRHWQYAATLGNLANLYRVLGKYELAESTLIEIKAIQEELLGKNHPEYARTLDLLGNLYIPIGAYEKAELLFFESKSIREKVFGRASLEYATSLESIFALYSTMSEYEKAEPFALEALDLYGKLLGKEHNLYIQVLKNLSVIYTRMGNYERAKQTLSESEMNADKLRQTNKPEYASAVNSIAIVYAEMGDYKKAEPFYIKAKSIWGEILGYQHPDYIWSLNNLGNLYLNTGDYTKAELFHLEVKDVRERILGKNHPDYATSLFNLGNIYTKTGSLEKAEPLYLSALQIFEEATGKQNYHYSECMHALANIYEMQGRFKASDTLLKDYTEISQSRLSKAINSLSERELSGYIMDSHRKDNWALSSLLARPKDKKGSLPTIAYDLSLIQKGFLLANVNRLNVLASATPETQALYGEFKAYRRRLAAEYANPTSERKVMEELEEKANATEKELARTVAGYAAAIQQVKWQAVQATLKPGEAAVEFVHFDVSFPKHTDSTMYAALLLLPGGSGPTFVPLFEEKQLEALVQVNSVRRAEYVDNLYAFNDQGVAASGEAKKTLYDLIWQPLEMKMGGVKTVYFSPSGLLHRLNLGAIPVGADETLADRYRFIELGSTRQLAISADAKPATNDAVLFGGIQYEIDSTGIAAANVAMPSGDMANRRGLGFAYSDATLRGGAWNYLKWTEKEVAMLESVLKTEGIQPTVLKGNAATEEAFKAIGNGEPLPRVLHIATHGFFFPDPKSAASSEGVSGEGGPVFKMSDHPMIRAGLILAGGNYAWKMSKPLKAGMEDGILTAYEISQMNLSNTELVVLSACETGLGDIQGNEGVYGLQRAFKIAGAKYLIMSLWQVPDYQTQELMTTFYSKWLKGKMSIPDAFQAAQSAMRQKYQNPYSWAGFVLVE